MIMRTKAAITEPSIMLKAREERVKRDEMKFDADVE